MATWSRKVVAAGSLGCVLGSSLVAASAAAAKTPTLTPVKEASGVLLFEAGRSDHAAINNYTASWRKRGDLTLSARAVTKNGDAWVAFSFRGS